MSTETALAKRDRAVVASLLLTGIRDGAVTGLRLHHVALTQRAARQDAREIHTKSPRP
ncbi:MAG: hypothetical protein AAFR17_03420 [Pseudomonadota bacterium]